MPRNQQGQRNNGAKLTAPQAALVKALWRDGYTQAQIERETGISRLNVWNIVHEKSWREIQPEYGSTVPVSTPSDLFLCRTCGEPKNIDDFPTNGRAKSGRSSVCRFCRNKGSVINNRQERERLLAHLGGKCACCGERTFEFLALDHVNGNGAEERRLTHQRNIVRKILNTTPPPADYRLLCHNCNLAYGFYGYCPHVRETT